MKRISEFIAEMQQPKTVKLVRNWKDMIPQGSRWNPGDPGNPACKVCQGVGYLRVDLPVGHPDFGKLLLCECVKVLQHPVLEPATRSYSNGIDDIYSAFDRGKGES